MHKSQLLLIVVFLGTLAFAATIDAQETQEWQVYPSGSAKSVDYVKNFVDKYRYDLHIIDSFAKKLQIAGRLHEVVNLYEHSQKYHPKNRKLLVKLKLAKSDLHESESIKTFNHQQHKKFSQLNEMKLAEIKCQVLQQEKNSEACKQIGDVNKISVVATNEIVTSKINKQQEIVHQNPVNQLSRNSYNYQPASELELDVGNFHALVIGNNSYPHFPKLESAVYDAKAVAKILRTNYNFEVTELENANRYEIFQKLSTLRKQLGENDNLLIYYAGHGYLDDATQRGYWLPVDAEEHNYANWLPTTDITDMLNGMMAKRVLVVADSCYSGTLTRNIRKNPESALDKDLKWLKAIEKKRSRTVMTSGGLEPVLDSGAGNHSVFTQAFINALIDNKNILQASKMFANVKHAVLLNADQTPEYADIRKAGHEGGDFIFVRTN